MGRKRQKLELVEKVSEELNVPVEDLERLPVDALEILDAATPDEDSHIEIESPVLDKPQTFLGFHPTTGEKVYL